MTSADDAPNLSAILISGVAGSGKSTLGRAVASALHAPLLDLDTLTNPLLDALPRAADEPHWLASKEASQIRAGRYAALLETAREVLSTAGKVVLAAPFTAELRGGREWQELRAALAPAVPDVIQLVGSDTLFAFRRAKRGEHRDAHRPGDPAEREAPQIPVLPVSAQLTTETQLAQVLAALGMAPANNRPKLHEG